MSSLKQLHPVEYRIWKGMRARCYSPCNASVGYYQKDGIKVCKRWDSFDNFYSDMGDRPPGYSIDRIDTKGDYCPENCRWASWETQAKNRGSFNINITYNGRTMCLKDWAKEFDIHYQTLIARVKRFPNLSFDEIIHYEDPRAKKIEWQGKKYSRKELCDLYKIPLVNFYDRIHKGWTLEKVLTTPVKVNPSKQNYINN